MSKPWRLTRSAERSLVDIAAWTYENFGPRQADAYESDLIDRCNAIASRQAATQDCSILVGDDAGEGLRFTRAGEHFVVFIESPDQIVIVDFLHSRSDLLRRIAGLKSMRGL